MTERGGLFYDEERWIDLKQLPLSFASISDITDGKSKWKSYCGVLGVGLELPPFVSEICTWRKKSLLEPPSSSIG